MRVRRSFAFIDLSGFSALTEVDGDERAVAILSAFRSLVRDICSRRTVRVAKWLGDGAMLVAVETTPLIAATMEMQVASRRASEPMALRCGLTADDVILLEGDDYIGHAVNVAARLCDVAPGGEVWAGRGIVEHLPKWVTVLSAEEKMLRSLEHPLYVSRLGLARLEGTVFPDPVCGIPLTLAVADNLAQDALGNPVLFCSDSCRDTWDHRPRERPDGQGSLRIPLIGS
jgi:class 3 adenylate cyclase